MVNRLTIVLEQPEYSGLLKMAAAEFRQPESQIRFLVRHELERRGLLDEHYTAVPPTHTAVTQGVQHDPD